MSRMLRIEGLVKSNTESDKLDLSDYSLEDLEHFEDVISKEIEKRLKLSEGEIEIEWEGHWTGGSALSDMVATVKKPYLAIIKPHGVRRFDYEFLKLVRIQEKDGSFKFSYFGFLPIGTVLKGRVTTGEEHFYRVVVFGLKIIEEMEVLRIIAKMKKKMKEEEKESEGEEEKVSKEMSKE